MFHGIPVIGSARQCMWPSDGVYAGHIVISDEIKQDAGQGHSAAKSSRAFAKTVMLTGDAKAVGESVAKELGLDEVSCRTAACGQGGAGRNSC